MDQDKVQCDGLLTVTVMYRRVSYKGCGNY
jgi:hypothetical protein